LVSLNAEKAFGNENPFVRHEQKIVVQSPLARLDFSTSLEMTTSAPERPTKHYA
jgi:hypothetical protein